ncbi:MAG: hypothetical protein OHK0029_04550 [Armatimonadaceae bacterium]
MQFLCKIFGSSNKKQAFVILDEQETVKPAKPAKKPEISASGMKIRTLAEEEGTMSKPGTRQPRSDKDKEKESAPLSELLGVTVADAVLAAADTLGRSCLYFTRENIAALGTPPDLRGIIEKLDPAMRSALIDGSVRVEEGERFHAVTLCSTDLRGGMEAARIAAQLFGLLRDCKLPATGFTPLRRLTDSALETLNAAAKAARSGCAEEAQNAQKLAQATETLGAEVEGVVTNLAEYRSPTLCRIIRAAVYAVLVSTHLLSGAAISLVLPPEPEAKEKDALLTPLV